MFGLILAISLFFSADAEVSDFQVPTNNEQVKIKRHYGWETSEKFDGLPAVIHDSEFIESLPESFDAREQWPECPSLKEIRDQGECGSCWAFASVEAMTDRICIQSKGKEQKHLSAEEVASCIGSDGCLGAKVQFAYDFWVHSGIVSGNGYKSDQGCQPYTIPSCTKYVMENENCPYAQNVYNLTTCHQECEQGYNVSFNADKSYGKSYYSLSGEENIMAEIFKNGPVTATFMVYSDFQKYSGGVYEVGPDAYFVGEGHAMKILGWGVENNQKYWLIANSWGAAWGPLEGYVKFLKGTDQCNIESNVVAGLPK